MNSDGNGAISNGASMSGALHGGFECVGMSGLSAANELVWRCDTMRAGRLYYRTLFDTREEAEEFATRMRQSEPDQMFNVESIKASQVWN